MISDVKQADEPTPARACDRVDCPRFHALVVCPVCEAETYKRGEPQVRRWLEEQSCKGRVIRSL